MPDIFDEVFGPSPESDPSEWEGDLHTLIVKEVVRPPDGLCDDGELDYEIEHPPACKQETYESGGHTGQVWTCDVGERIGDCGLEFNLCYSGTPITEPGTYTIRGWGRRYYVHDYGAYEYDAGVTVVNDEEASDG